MKIKEFIDNNPDRDIKKYSQFRKNGFIYFICKGNGEIIYIGTTNSLDCRIQQHSYRIEFYKKQVFFFEAPMLKCLEIEKALISEINPKYNISSTGRDKKRKHSEGNIQAIKSSILFCLKYDKISQKQLARELKVSVSQLLDDDASFSGDKLAKIVVALDSIRARRRVHLHANNGNTLLEA